MNSYRSMKPAVFASMIFLLALFVGLPMLWLVAVKAKMRRAEADVLIERKAAIAENLPLTADAMRRNPPVPDADNAAPIYRKISEGLNAKRKQYNLLEKDALQVTSLKASPDEKAKGFAAANQLIALSQPELELMKQAAQKPSCDFHYNWEKGAGVLFPQFADMREMARLLVINAEVLDKADKPLEALQQIATGGKLVDHLSQEQTLIGMLVCIAIEAIMDHEWHTLVNRHAGERAFLERAAKVNTAFGAMPTLKTALRGEVWMGMWSVNKIQAGKFKPEDFGADEGAKLPQISQQMAGVYEKNLLAFWRKAFHELNETQGDSMQSAQVMIKAAAAEEVAAKNDPAGHALNGILMPVFSQAGLKVVQIDAMRRMRTLKIELLKSRLAQGSFPKNLNGFAPKMTTDPFNSKPLIYRLEGKGFILYSVGQNSVDDGGQRKVGDNGMADIVTTYP